MSSLGPLPPVYYPSTILPKSPSPSPSFNISGGKSLALTLSINASSAPATYNPMPTSSDFLRKIAVSSLLFLGLGFCHHRAVYASTAPIVPDLAPVLLDQDVTESHDTEDVDAEEMKEEFERWKAKIYSLTVPLRIVALRNSLPPIWFKDFLSSQGKRLRLQPQFRQSLQEIYSELSMPLDRGTTKPNSVSAADIVSVGDSWLGFAVKEGLIEPIQGIEEHDWFKTLGDKWKDYVRRSSDGNMSSCGQIWAVPYRCGSVVIAYKKNKFQKYNLAPIEDWADLWRPELAGKISMVNSPREIVGAVLKCMGSSYNAHDFDSQVFGGKTALCEKLASLVKQVHISGMEEKVRLFDSQYYLRAFAVDEVWVAVGWSSDVLPVAKRMSNVAVIVPKSGASLWADFWAVPSTSRLKTQNIGGRVRGPSPLVHQWLEFCLQPERATSFTEGAVPGASPIPLGDRVQGPENLTTGQPKLDTNLVSCVSPTEILSRCEFLEPLPEETLREYQQLINSVKKLNHSGMQTSLRRIFSALRSLLS